MTALLAIAAAIRVFSADYCADQIVLAIAAPENIAALSVDAEKDFSYLRKEAAPFKKSRADAEAVIGADADVVLRFWGGDAARLEKLGIKVVSVDYASDFEGVRQNISVAAAAIGREAQGAALLRDIDARIAALRARADSGMSALYVTPGGVTAGKHTIIDAIFSAAGVGNIAAEKGLDYWPPLSAEALVASPPKFIVTGFFSANSERVNNWSAARHPAIREVIARTPHVDLSANVLSCPGWFSLDAAEAIRNAVDRDD